MNLCRCLVITPPLKVGVDTPCRSYSILKIRAGTKRHLLMISFKASFVRFTTTGKTAICMARAPFSNDAVPVYLNADDIRDINPSPTKGDVFDLPEGLKIVDLYVWDKETETRVVATTEDGVILKTVSFA